MEEKSLGDYLLLKELGSGSFGVVFLAEHRFLKKKYALKLLSDEFSQNSAFIARFEKEIGALAFLDHPAILKLHNISCDKGQYFLVSDALIDHNEKSATLERFLSKKNRLLGEKEIEMILKQVASSLDYVHELTILGEKLVHRGLKLNNIFVQEGEGAPQVRVADFGLARLLGEKRLLAKSYEAFLEGQDKGLFLADLAFLSPEQKSGEEKNITVKSDVYAFGVLAYYLITRRWPEGYFELPSNIAPEYRLNWNRLICQCLSSDYRRRPERLTEAMNTLLSEESGHASSLDVLSWEEVEKKVENAMQMSFEFLPKEEKNPKTENLVPESEKNEERSLKPLIGPSQIERPLYEPDPGAIFQKELNVSHYEPVKTEFREVEPLLTEMVIIPGGAYKRGSLNGSRDELPVHTIKISSFALDIHPVTNEQFQRFLEALGGEKDANNNDVIRLRDSRIRKIGGQLCIESGYLKHPVVGVTWYGAAAFAKWVGKRLPTEAEWEIASMGNLEDALYPTGLKIDHTQANFFSSDTTAVMSYPPNGYGLYDMVGNVYEWCLDWYAYNYYETASQEPENPKGPPQGVYRVLRGGCWKSLKEDLRCAHRHRNNPGAFNSTYGFRCSADVS
jgi:formylglycine-generating enzyme required for sulfatase activity